MISGANSFFPLLQFKEEVFEATAVVGRFRRRHDIIVRPKIAVGTNRRSVHSAAKDHRLSRVSSALSQNIKCHLIILIWQRL